MVCATIWWRRPGFIASCGADANTAVTVCRTRSAGCGFVCLNANIARQFEFVQNAWLMSTHFGGLAGESDPLLGNRHPIPGCPATGAFTDPRPDGVPRRLTGLPQFVTVRGGAYFFLPGLRALRYLASMPGGQAMNGTSSDASPLRTSEVLAGELEAIFGAHAEPVVGCGNSRRARR